ncbi:MAG: hypothetical protein M0R80_26760, partial [Proteobacteria bacterium]|nr:hypothetical protein [Pseudomonadota bacterium]
MTKRVGIAVCAAACLAAFGAGAEERAAGDRLAVFPLEGVNVTGSVVNASGEVLSSALRGQGIDVAEWQEGYRALYGEQDPPPPPPPPP